MFFDQIWPKREFPVENRKIALVRASMVVTYCIETSRSGADRHNGILISLLPLVAETKINLYSKAKKSNTNNVLISNINVTYFIKQHTIRKDFTDLNFKVKYLSSMTYYNRALHYNIWGKLLVWENFRSITCNPLIHMAILVRVPFYTDYLAPVPIYQEIEQILLGFEVTETAL